MRRAAAVLVPLLLWNAACASEITRDEPGPPITVVEPQYLILRPLSPDGTPGATLMDLSHFDMRTAEVVAPEVGDSYAVSLATTSAGDEILAGWTEANIGKQLGIYLDGKLIVSPFIRTRIESVILINVGSREQAAEIVARMRRGGKR